MKSRLLLSLLRDLDVTAKLSLWRVREQHTGGYSDRRLGISQRRVQPWRQIMVRKFVYACLDGQEAKPATLASWGPKPGEVAR